MSVVAKIHRQFDTAGEKLLRYAKRIIEQGNDKKAERLKKLGFTKSSPVAKNEKVEKAKSTVEAIEYFNTHYPNHKVLSEEQIKSICKKYHLLYGEATSYIGDVPEKNLRDVEAFTMREEDYFPDYSSIFPSYRLWNDSSFMFYNPLTGTVGPEENKSQEPPKPKKPPFRICAPHKDFKTDGYEIKEGYKLVYDPIIIQPVQYMGFSGGLVITKWGLEGNDESLINEKMN